MNILITGGSGLLGEALCSILQGHSLHIPSHQAYDLENGNPASLPSPDLAFLTAGTKGTEACEGNRRAFRSDVDGNIRLARDLLQRGAFVVFVSTDAVEWALHTAYARNRFMVELCLGGLPNVAIFRPGRFDETNVAACAQLCARVGLKRVEGLTKWP